MSRFPVFVLLLLTATLICCPKVATAQFGPFRPYRPNTSPYRPQYPVQPYRPAIRNQQPPAANQSNTVIVKPPKFQPRINTSPAPKINSNDDFKKVNFNNPSLDLLRELGERTPRADGSTYQRYPRLAGEFEPQRAILLSISDLMYQHYDVLKQIIRKTSPKVPLVILVNDRKQLKSAAEIADSGQADLSHVSFLQLDLNTIWLRDFGPRLIELENGAASIDFLYDGTRPKDDKFPDQWGRRSGDRNRTITWTLQGGNLISNGDGLAITSTRLFRDNMIRFPNPTRGMNVEYERRKIVVENFKQECNIDRLIFLHPLSPEATQHVDMYATFLAKDHVLVAELDPRADPYNANILNVNAALLKKLKVDGKPMRVDRIRIPNREDKYWSPYTNIILANDVVLIPVYDTDPPNVVRNAIATYRRLLPNATVETINMTSMKKLEGALHCMSINIPEFAQLPKDTIKATDAIRAFGLTLNTKASDRPAATPSRQSSSPQVASTSPGSTLAGNNQPDGTAPKPNPRSVNQKQTTNPPSTQFIEAQRKAADTYRRTFRDKEKRFSVDAAAVAIDSRFISLMRARDGVTIRVEIRELSPEDAFWIQQNRAKIQANGRLVQSFFRERGFN